MNYNELVNSFISDPESAIERCQEIICSVSNFDSYKDFYTYHLKNAHISTCQHQWSTPELSISCRDCANSGNSCICLSCFLNGNHKGHEYSVDAGSVGNCDCGDLSLWKRSGFCSKHSGLGDQDKNPQDYLDKNLQTLLTDVIFKAAFSSLSNFTNDDTEKAISIIQFISSFLKFGDGFRRLIVISLTEKFDLKGLMSGIVQYSKDFNQSFQKLCGGLINDQLFIRNFSIICYYVLDACVLKDSKNVMTHGNKYISYDIWNDFWFHSFNDNILEYNITHKKFRWFDFFCDNLAYTKELFSYVGSENFKDFPDPLYTTICSAFKATKIQPNEETQLFFDNLVEQHICSGFRKKENDGIIFASFKDDTEIGPYKSFFYFRITFYNVFYAFKDKPNLKFDKLFEALDEFLDINPIFYAGKSPIGSGNGEENDNDNFVLNFLNQDKFSQPVPLINYKSFHNGGSVFLSNPLIDSLVSLFGNDNISRIKIGRFLSSEKYHNLRVKLGIATMKTIASFVSNRLSIAAENNRFLKFMYKRFDDPTDITLYIRRFIPLFQLLLGIKCTEKAMIDEFCLKEFFAFEFAREFGLFDDFSSEDYDDENINEKQKQMVYSFLYMTLVFVCDRNLFHFDPDSIVEEQIIFALKQGVHSIDKLSTLYDKKAQRVNNRLDRFNNILMKVASTDRSESSNDIQESNNDNQESKNDNNDSDDDSNSDNKESSKSFQKEVLFYLKKGVKWNPISAINSLNKQMTILNEEISKKADELLKIPEYQPEETLFNIEDQTTNDENNDSDGLSINLRQFLMTPTVISIVYHTLRTGTGDDSPISDLNDHLAMNILILIAKFIKEDSKESPENPIKITEMDYSSLHDLIAKMKNEIYNCNAEKNSIECTLDQRSFVSLLNIKFSSENLPPKSFIDVLMNKGKLGQEVLNQISFYVHLDCIAGNDNNQQSTKEDINTIKHNKAKKLKEEIMSQYKSMLANYNISNQRESDSIDGIGSISNSITIAGDTEVCSICSTHKKDEIFAYPLYIYRTKLPFIIDKPPMLEKDEVADEIEIDDNLGDISISIDENEEEDEEEQSENEDGDLMRLLFLLLGKKKSSKKEKKKLNRRFKKQQKEENIEYKLSKEDQQFKRCTAGANFVLQFGICPHPVHPTCVKDDVFTCPIDRSVKNGLLPCLEFIPKSIIFKNSKTFELSNDPNTLGESAINSISSFIKKVTSFFNNKPINVFVELAKSISGLISTYEIRLRSLVDCLDSEKTFFLSRNLFLTVWYSYRIQKKPNICSPDDEKRLTVFQRFIKKLIENDNNNKSGVNEIVSSFINSNDDLKEEKLYLFLRRVCLAEHFLLNNCEFAMANIIDWDEILSPTSLAERYNVKFTTIDDDFEFKPFSFISLPQEFLRLNLEPFNLPITRQRDVLLFNILDYNYLINNYDEISGEILDKDEESIIKKNKKNLVSSENGAISDIFSIFYSKKYYPSVVLFVGKYSSNVVVVDQDYYATFNPFYLDKYGCPDVGFKRSQPLFFNEERYEKFVDKILSGEFTNSLNPISDYKD